MTTYDYSSRYTSQAFAALELRHLWPRTWQCLAHQAEVAPGQAMAFDIGLDSVLLMRAQDGEIKGFWNVCPHRGARLVGDKPCKGKHIRCAVHGWQWGASGELVAVPSRNAFAGTPQFEERAQLRPVAVEVWNGLVFAHLGENPRPLREELGDLATALDPWQPTSLQLVQNHRTVVRANWKLCLEIFLERYHLPTVHPQAVGVFDFSTEQFQRVGRHSLGSAVLFPLAGPGTGSQMCADLERLLTRLGVDPDPLRQAPAATRTAVQAALRKRIDADGWHGCALSDDQLVLFTNLFVFPNLLVSCYPDLTVVQRYRPHPDTPEQSFLDQMVLIRSGQQTSASDAAARPVTPGDGALGLVTDQDLEVLPQIQAGHRGRGLARPILGDLEHRLADFAADLDEVLGLVHGQPEEPNQTGLSSMSRPPQPAS